MFKKSFICAAGMAALALATSAANANSIGLNVGNATDDVASDTISISYTVDAVNGNKFTTTGGISEKVTNHVTSTQTALSPTGTFTLTAYLNTDGTLDTTRLNLDSLIVTGNGGTLYSSAPSSLVAFGFSTAPAPASPVFEFLFSGGTGTFGQLGAIGVKITGGSLTPAYTGSSSYFANSFSTTNFLNTSASDTFTVAPLPDSALMGLTSLPVLSLMLRRRKA
jgi:hypothetical protein